MKLNHVLVRTTDLAAMHRFWTTVIGLEPTPRPPFPFHGAWFGQGSESMVHVVEDRRVQPDGGPIAHVAIECADYHTLIDALKEHEVYYIEIDVPLSGERQVFVAGPDGLTVEMLFPIGVDNQPHRQEGAA